MRRFVHIAPVKLSLNKNYGNCVTEVIVAQKFNLLVILKIFVHLNEFRQRRKTIVTRYYVNNTDNSLQCKSDSKYINFHR